MCQIHPWPQPWSLQLWISLWNGVTAYQARLNSLVGFALLDRMLKHLLQLADNSSFIFGADGF